MRNTEHCHQAIQSKSKNSRYQAQGEGPYNPFVLCRMFATRKGGKLRLFMLTALALASHRQPFFVGFQNRSTRRNMKHNKKAFTLIELLVVVLIIGILAAIALPQYQVTITRTKLMRTIPLIESLHQAQERYYLANGTYSQGTTRDSYDNLDIELPDNAEWDHNSRSMYIGEARITMTPISAEVWFDDLTLGYVSVFDHMTQKYNNTEVTAAGKKGCSYYNHHYVLAKKVCDGLTGKKDSNYDFRAPSNSSGVWEME